MICFFFISANFLACAPSPRLYMQHRGQFTQSQLAEILASNPLAPGQNIRVVNLGSGKETSHHLVQIRDREKPHVHRTHDLTVFMLKGKGYLMLGQKRIDLGRGDVLFIPRETVHYYVNTHSEPSVGLAVFSPVFRGKDSVPVNETSGR